jgi:plasmid stabilization system protein ParE
MKRRYRLTPAARAGLLEIEDYLHEQSPQAAVLVRNKLRQAMLRLAPTGL